MSSKKKKNKLKNAYLWPGGLKEKDMKIKRLLFFTSSKRKSIKRITKEDLE
jgi:hypothetical protein